MVYDLKHLDIYAQVGSTEGRLFWKATCAMRLWRGAGIPRKSKCPPAAFQNPAKLKTCAVATKPGGLLAVSRKSVDAAFDVPWDTVYAPAVRADR